MFYTYNYTEKKWTASEKLQPVSDLLLVRPSIKRAWCPVHKRWEKYLAGANGERFLSCSYKVQERLTEEEHWNVRMVEVEYRADVHQIYVYADTVYYYCSPNMVHKKYGYAEWTFNMYTGTTHENYIYSRNDKLVMPKDVITEIQKLLSLEAKRIYGIAYKNSCDIVGMIKLKAFVKTPACPQLAILERFMNGTYQNVVDRKDRNPYVAVCNYLRIKPSKKMRKLFNENPFVIPGYMVLHYWGFTDKNIMATFFENTSLCLHYFSEAVLNPDTRLLLINDKYYDIHWFYCDVKKLATSRIIVYLRKWTMRALGVTTERAVMTRLIFAMRGERTTFEDAAKMFYQCYDNLPAAVINHAVRECFTEDVHDELANFVPDILLNHTYRKNIEFDYTLDEKALEDTVNGFEFVLPKTSNALYNFGDLMHNCVGMYIDDVLRKRCLIVSVVNEKGKGVACLELRHKNIVQAKAPCNAEIDLGLQLVIFKWMKRHGIASDTRDLMTDKLVQAMFWRQCA